MPDTHTGAGESLPRPSCCVVIRLVSSFRAMLRASGSPLAAERPLAVSMGQTDAALGTTASQNLAAVGSGHALTETMDLGAMTLLGLIGTNHAETPPVQIGKAQSPYGGLCRPPQHPVWDAVGKINALNSAHEIIPKSTPSVKKNSNLFSQELGNTRCCVGIFSF